MASPQQPPPPTNPFDGFDNYSTVAQQQPPAAAPTQQPFGQQPQQQPPQQWGQPVAHQQQQQQQQPGIQPFATPAPPPVAANANPFASPAIAIGQSYNPAASQQQQQPPTQQAHLANQPNQQQQQQQQQLVTMPPNQIVQSPWALQPVGGVGQPGAPPAPAQSYDPLGIFGAPAPAPQQQQMQQFQQQPPAQQPFQQQQQQTVQQQFPGQEQLQAQQYGYGLQQPQQQQSPATAAQNLNAEAQQFSLDNRDNSILPGESDDEGLALVDVELEDDTDAGDGDDGQRNDFEERESEKKSRSSRKSRGSPRGSTGAAASWDRNADLAPPPPVTPGRRHAEYLAQNSANHLSSPLPKQELVHHSGYVLSRISFRTVLMRKWKQTFWIQYGPTQLLFFRSFADYEDWLNNPYHTAKAREFLVKLRVDFVSDLKKASVMGYQVTQVRRKPYGKNVMLHFKLERWMDYGPTIAAAFAAREEEMLNSPTHHRGRASGDGQNDSNDVAALRKIILGCMRNARDAALVASQRQGTDMGEAVGYRGRYDEEHQRESRIPTGDRNMGYHQAFSAESSGRRRVDSSDDPSSPNRESLKDEGEEAAEVPAPIVDLLG